MSLSLPDRDLAQLAASSRLDGTLSALAGIASSGSTYSVGLLINGMTVYGRVESAREFFVEVDAENDRMIARTAAAGTEWSEESLAQIRGSWTKGFDEDEREERELIAGNPDRDFDAMSAEDQRQTIEKRSAVLTLADATVIPPGDRHFKVPLMRVRLALVAAWWLVPVDEKGIASLTHPSVVSAA